MTGNKARKKVWLTERWLDIETEGRKVGMEFVGEKKANVLMEIQFSVSPMKNSKVLEQVWKWVTLMWLHLVYKVTTFIFSELLALHFEGETRTNPTPFCNMSMEHNEPQMLQSIFRWAFSRSCNAVFFLVRVICFYSLTLKCLPSNIYGI